MDEQDFGLRLRELRHARRETLEQVSEATGLSVAMLSRVERSERLPSPDSVEALAKHFGLPVEDLMSETIANRMLNRYGLASSQHAAEKMRSVPASGPRSYGIFSETPIDAAFAARGPARPDTRRRPPHPGADASSAMQHRDRWVADEVVMAAADVATHDVEARPEELDALSDAAHVAEVALRSALAAARRAQASGDPRQVLEAERVLERLRRALGEG